MIKDMSSNLIDLYDASDIIDSIFDNFDLDDSQYLDLRNAKTVIEDLIYEVENNNAY